MLCWTLQKYIFREMGKTFVLTSIGLVALLGLGGGVVNMMELEGVTVGQLLKIIALILPVSASLTLPIAALFSATATYGRLSAANEFVACRSGGINILVLLLPTLLLSLLSAGCTFFFINFLIPGMVMNIDRYIGADLPRIIKQQLTTPNRLGLLGDRFRIYADRCDVVPVAEGQNSPEALRLARVAFVEKDGADWSRFGTAQDVSIQFEIQPESATIAIDMHHVRLYDAKAGRYVDIEHQPVERFTISQRIPLKVKWLDLGELLRYGRHPSLFPEVETRLAAVRAAIAEAMFYREVQRQFRDSAERIREYGEVRVSDQSVQYVIQAPVLQPGARDNRALFSDGVRILEMRRGDHGFTLRRTVTADTAALVMEPDRSRRQLLVNLQAAGNVTVTYAGHPDDDLRKEREGFDSLDAPAKYVEQGLACSDDEILDVSDNTLGFSEEVTHLRMGLAKEVGHLSREIAGILHSRLAFSLSVFVLVILGAVLGIVFRGAHVLTAFGISFVPSLFVIAMIIMGKQLIDNPSTTAVGIGLIWAGIAFVAAVDLFVMTRVLRR